MIKEKPAKLALQVFLSVHTLANPDLNFSYFFTSPLAISHSAI